MTDFPQMAEIKTAAMGSPRAASPLMDASKLNARGTYCFAPLDAVDHIVVDQDEKGRPFGRPQRTARRHQTPPAYYCRPIVGIRGGLKRKDGSTTR